MPVTFQSHSANICAAAITGQVVCPGVGYPDAILIHLVREQHVKRVNLRAMAKRQQHVPEAEVIQGRGLHGKTAPSGQLGRHRGLDV